MFLKVLDVIHKKGQTVIVFFNYFSLISFRNIIKKAYALKSQNHLLPHRPSL